MIKKQDKSSRAHLIISGDVQGVGYRAWAKRHAIRLHLVGWVKNREDGAVELVAEGNVEAIETFITICREGPEISDVRDIATTWLEKTGEFDEFMVLY